MRRLRILIIIVIITCVQSVNAEADRFSMLSQSQSLGIAHGAHIRPVVEYGVEIQNFNSLVQKDLAVVMYFLDWSERSVDVAHSKFLDPWLLDRIRASFGNNSPVIMLTWAPLDGRKTLGGRSACDRDYNGAIPLDALIAGKCDDFIRGFAQALKERPERFLVRFAHEMNISDIPWWPGHFNQDAAKFVEMWRHVYTVFKSENVPNAEWVWSPNYASYPAEPWNDVHNYYPGDEYLDWIGIDGYNWNWNSNWHTFTDLYDNVLKELSCMHAKPLIISEIGTVEGSGTRTKASWISNTYELLPTYPFVRGIVWFNDYASANPAAEDFRVTAGSGSNGGVYAIPVGSGAWTNAYRQAIANNLYTTYLPSLDEATPPMTYCGSGEPIVELSSSLAILRPGESSYHIATVITGSGDTQLTLELPQGAGFSGSVQPGVITAPWSSSTIHIQTSLSTPTGTYSVFLNANGHMSPIQILVSSTASRIHLPFMRK